MNNKFKEPARLVQELEAIGLESNIYRNRTNKRGWVVCAWINLRNIDKIITSKNMWEKQIWEWGYSSGSRIIGYYLIREDGKITVELHCWNHYRVIRLKDATDPIEIIKINHLLSRIKRKLFGIRGIIQSVVREGKY